MKKSKIDWPVKSRDLNIVEDIWEILSDRVCDSPHENMKDFTLWQLIILYKKLTVHEDNL